MVTKPEAERRARAMISQSLPNMVEARRNNGAPPPGPEYRQPASPPVQAEREQPRAQRGGRRTY